MCLCACLCVGRGEGGCESKRVAYLSVAVVLSAVLQTNWRGETTNRDGVQLASCEECQATERKRQHMGERWVTATTSTEERNCDEGP